MLMYVLYRCLPPPAALARMQYICGDRCAGMLRWYQSTHESIERQLSAWHRSELRRLDLSFRFQDANQRLIRARLRARELGIGPLDPRYPDIDEYLE